MQILGVSRSSLPGSTVTLTHDLECLPAQPVDTLISTEMLDHIVSRAAAEALRHVAVYRDFFRRAHGWARPGAWFALHTTLRELDAQDAELNRSPRVQDIIQAVSPYWELMEVQIYQDDDHRTASEWLARLRAADPCLGALCGDRAYASHDQELQLCLRRLEHNQLTLAHFSLRRCS
jgi:cyclopropane fatty-acyl-phospholipid synthase-like methyltransferase